MQDSSRDVRITRWQYDKKQDIYIVSKYLPQICLSTRKGETVTVQRASLADATLTSKATPAAVRCPPPRATSQRPGRARQHVCGILAQSAELEWNHEEKRCEVRGFSRSNGQYTSKASASWQTVELSQLGRNWGGVTTKRRWDSRWDSGAEEGCQWTTDFDGNTVDRVLTCHSNVT